MIQYDLVVRRYRQIAKTAGLSGEFPYAEHRNDHEIPYLKFVEGGRIEVLFSERGRESKIAEAANTEELMYLIFSNIAKRGGVGYELNHRVRGRDHTDVHIAKAVEYLGSINEDWGRRLSKEFQDSSNKNR